MKVTNCSMGCMYAEGGLDKCQCVCGGVTHGLMAPHSTPRVACTPSAALKCQSGEEGGDCKCACQGANHGLYRTIENFDIIPIVGYQV